MIVVDTIISILILVVPVAVFLAIRFANQQGSNKYHWPRPKKVETPESNMPTTTKRAEAKTVSGPSCGRDVTHAMLTIIGARNSCKHCAALPR